MPTRGGVAFLREVWHRIDHKITLDICRSVEDILRHYKIDNPEFELAEHNEEELGPVKYNAFPIILRVPEGEELESAEAIRKHPDIQVAVPNFLIRSQARIGIDTEFLSSALGSVSANPIDVSLCGKNVRVAIIDTGVDPTHLEVPSQLHRRQFSVDGPSLEEAAENPEDRDGHGSVVARIVNAIAPAAQMLSVRVMDGYGNLGGVVAALLVAHAAFRPHIMNLSFSLTCDPRICNSCGNAIGLRGELTLAQVRLLFSLIDNEIGGRPLFVAAAGNNTPTISMPATFPEVLAVGACDLDFSIPQYSRFKSVDSKTFLVAPGGAQGNQAYAHRPGPGLGLPPDLFGTSFSAAVVSGIAARYACAIGGGSCAMRARKTAADGERRMLVECLRASANNDFSGYDPEKHGFGIARYDVNAARLALAATSRASSL